MMFARLLRPGTEGAFESVARSHVGRVRAVNEDRLLNRPDRALWAVADGMGGHFGGDVAAETAIAALRRLADGRRRIDTTGVTAALADANADIHLRARAAHGTCGTTIVVAHVDGATLHLWWAGDSRAYLVRRDSARLLTTDHTLVQEMVAAGALDADAARHHPRANVVTRALGVEPAVRLDHLALTIDEGDRVLLCSDGLSKSLSDGDMAGDGEALDSQADGLLARALERDGSDNISLVLIAA